jgi:hypothetical protein
MEKEERRPTLTGISPFERIRRTNAAGAEYWSSRDFAQVLGYTDYRNFGQVIQKARVACFNSGQRIEDHFVDITEMIEIVGAKVRKTIQELGGTMPENLPPAESIKKLEARKRKQPKMLKEPPNESHAESDLSQEGGM